MLHTQNTQNKNTSNRHTLAHFTKAQSVELLTIQHIIFIDFIILGKCTSDDTNWSCCSTDHKCGIGKGDCDKDADCESGLKCGHDNCSNDFPSKWYDCCYNPGKLV